jgi:3-deoxy-manno-octulosonate cytidylyltransferase (CMP-KDO synthetase)
VVNVQGDLPTLEPAVVRAALAPLADPAVDIATLVAEIRDPVERDNPNVVKAVVALKPGARSGRALYFSRLPVPGGDGPHWHHIGLYAYRRRALARFVALPPGELEKRERLEQLRALEDGMRIDAVVVDTVPLGVDTPAELERARVLLAS